MILLRVRTQLHKTHTHTKEKKRLVEKKKGSKRKPILNNGKTEKN